MWVDDSLEDGYVTVSDDERGWDKISMTIATYRALASAPGALRRLCQGLYDQRGMFLVPRSVIEPDAAEDLRLGLALVDPEPSDYCIYPPCGLQATEMHKDGFPLCKTHLGLMSDWDDLVAP